MLKEFTFFNPRPIKGTRDTYDLWLDVGTPRQAIYGTIFTRAVALGLYGYIAYDIYRALSK